MRHPLLSNCITLNRSLAGALRTHEKLMRWPFSSTTLQFTLLPSVGMRPSGAWMTNTASPALGLLERALKAATLGLMCSGLPGTMTVPERQGQKDKQQMLQFQQKPEGSSTQTLVCRWQSLDLAQHQIPGKSISAAHCPAPLAQSVAPSLQHCRLSCCRALGRATAHPITDC